MANQNNKVYDVRQKARYLAIGILADLLGVEPWQSKAAIDNFIEEESEGSIAFETNQDGAKWIGLRHNSEEPSPKDKGFLAYYLSQKTDLSKDEVFAYLDEERIWYPESKEDLDTPF